MLQVYADGVPVYSPYLDGYNLTTLKAVIDVDKAGTAEITMPPGHPCYNAFTSYKTIVTIYRQGVLLFRGRALYPVDDFYRCRTITCEGERCFLRDGVLRPYLYQTTPADIFTDIIGKYNQQVEPEKRFTVGEVTVIDGNNYVRFESEQAVKVSEAVDKLVTQCGGYITFSTDADGARVINWVASVGRLCGQAIEFGVNLLDYTRTGANTDLATAVVPYGAKGADGKRLDITSVNGGLDYIQDDKAVALRGFIAVPLYWDDVTVPEHLMTKARHELNRRKLIVSTLDLSAVDLSELDRDIETYAVGDWVQVLSTPHGLREVFQLRTRTYNLLDPAQDRAVFGAELATLTGLDVSGDRTGLDQLQRTAQNIRTDYAQAIEASRAGLAIAPKVNASGQYMTGDGLLLQWGSVTVTPSAANVATPAALVFAYAYTEAPAVLVSPVTDAPAAVSASVSAVDATGATVSAAAPTVDPVTVYWLAIGQGAESVIVDESSD